MLNGDFSAVPVTLGAPFATVNGVPNQVAPSLLSPAAIAIAPKQARGFFLSHRAHREIDLRFKDGIHALESLRRDPADGGGFSIDEDFCSDGARITVESFLPVAVAENHEERFAGRFGLAG